MKKKNLGFEKLEVISDSKLRTIKGGKSISKEEPTTSNTITIPGGKDDGDDGIKTD